MQHKPIGKDVKQPDKPEPKPPAKEDSPKHDAVHTKWPEPAPEPPPAPKVKAVSHPVAPKFPEPHADGSNWTEAEHEQAVQVYLKAVESGDPDAGRMRAMLGIHGHPEKSIG